MMRETDIEIALPISDKIKKSTVSNLSFDMKVLQLGPKTPDIQPLKKDHLLPFL